MAHLERLNGGSLAKTKTFSKILGSRHGQIAARSTLNPGQTIYLCLNSSKPQLHLCGSPWIESWAHIKNFKDPVFKHLTCVTIDKVPITALHLTRSLWPLAVLLGEVLKHDCRGLQTHSMHGWVSVKIRFDIEVKGKREINTIIGSTR